MNHVYKSGVESTRNTLNTDIPNFLRLLCTHIKMQDAGIARGREKQSKKKNRQKKGLHKHKNNEKLK